MSTHRTSYYENAILLHQLGGSAFSAPSTLYGALLTAGDAEPTIGANYARQAVAFGAPSAITNGREIANSATVTWPQNNSGSSHGTMTQWAIYDAATGGNQLWKGPLDSSVAYDDGVQPEAATGAVKLQLVRVDDGGSNFEGGSDALFDLELNHLRNNSTWAQPTYTMGLLTTFPSNPGSLTGLVEVTGGSYARQSVSWGSPDAEGTTVTGGRASFNTAEVSFGANDIGSTQSVVGWALHDGTAFRHCFRDAVSWPTSATLRYPIGNLYLGAS